MTPPRRLTKSIARLPLWQVDALAAGVICLGAAIWYFAGLSPLMEARAAREDIQARLADAKDALDKQNMLVKTRESSLEKLRADNAKARVQLQPVTYVNQQVQELTRMAEKCGLVVDEIKPQAAVPEERFTAVPIKVIGTGAYPAMTGFLRDLRSKFHDTGVTGFSLEGKADNPEDPLKFTLSLVWYAAPPPPRVEKK